jgi:hypothetical protein
MNLSLLFTYIMSATQIIFIALFGIKIKEISHNSGTFFVEILFGKSQKEELNIHG